MSNESNKANKDKGKFHVEPFLWSAFGNGGTIAAILFPIVILVFCLLIPMGVYDPAVVFANMSAFYNNIIGKLIIFMLLAFNLWHACHRIYHGSHDLKYHPPLWFKFAIYGVAALGSVVVIYLLF